MSETIDQLKDDLRAAYEAATVEVTPEQRARFARIVERAGQHFVAGNMTEAGADLVTIKALMYAEARARAKAAYQSLVTAIVQAAVRGVVVAL